MMPKHLTVQKDRISQNNFNFLRLLFASLVLLSHAPELADGNRNREILTRLFGSVSFGELAVDGFFLLSGYLIVKSWQMQPLANVFLQKRALRIYPAFIVASVLGGFLIGPLGSGFSEYFSAFSLSGFIAATALLQPTFTPPVFEGQPYAHINGSMWTIGYEFLCYLSVLSLGLLGVIKRRWLWFTLSLSVTLIYFFSRAGGVKLDANVNVGMLKDVITLPLLVRLSSFFLVGGCFFLFRDKIPFKRAYGLVALFALIVGLNSYSLSEASIAIFGAYLLFYFAQIPVAALQAFRKLPDISYGLYLYGWPVQKLLLWYIPSMSPWILFPISLLLCAVLGFLSWEAVEKPCMKWRERNLVALSPINVPVSR